MTLRTLVGHCATALAIAAGSFTAAQAQPSAAGSVSPPVRADIVLSGKVLAQHNASDRLACQNECKGTAGCSGYSFNRNAKASCTLLSGALADVAVMGAVSCRMPCEPGPHTTALPKRLPATALRDPVLASSPVSDRPVSLLPAAPGLRMRQLPAAGGSTASTQSASFGTGCYPIHAAAALCAGSRFRRGQLR